MGNIKNKIDKAENLALRYKCITTNKVHPTFGVMAFKKAKTAVHNCTFVGGYSTIQLFGSFRFFQRHHSKCQMNLNFPLYIVLFCIRY